MKNAERAGRNLTTLPQLVKPLKRPARGNALVVGPQSIPKKPELVDLTLCAISVTFQGAGLFQP
jgi:hypothetical protein